jgi:hypothetical protein
MFKLYVGKKFTGIAVVVDATWPGMFRVCGRDGRLSDMVNLSRAKDAAIAWAQAAGFFGGRQVRDMNFKKHREPAGSPPMRSPETILH